MARRNPRVTSRHPRIAREELANRNVLPQDRDAAESAADARAAGQCLGPARRCEDQAAGIYQWLLRIVDQLQCAVRRRSGPVQRWRRRLRQSRARYTSPMPPAPRAERISYGPRRVPVATPIATWSARGALVL